MVPPERIQAATAGVAHAGVPQSRMVCSRFHGYLLAVAMRVENARPEHAGVCNSHCNGQAGAGGGFAAQAVAAR